MTNLRVPGHIAALLVTESATIRLHPSITSAAYPYPPVIFSEAALTSLPPRAGTRPWL